MIFFLKNQVDASLFSLTLFSHLCLPFPMEAIKSDRIEKSMEVSCTTVWNDCLEVVRENVGEENFNTWFKPIAPLRVDGDVLTIQVPSQFFYEWLEDNYVPVLKRAIHINFNVCVIRQLISPADLIKK